MQKEKERENRFCANYTGKTQFRLCASILNEVNFMRMYRNESE